MKCSIAFTGLVSFVATVLFLNTAFADSANWRKRVSDEEVVTVSDVVAEITFGREIAARIFGKYKPYDNAELIKYVNLVGLSLVKSTNRPELEFHFMVLDADEVNAFAAPGGYIFVTKGALKLMKDESELAGVLAHEIGHVTEKHVVKEMKIKGSGDSEADSVTQGLAFLVGGNSQSARAAFSQAIDKGLDLIFKNGYKKTDELQADRDATLNTALVGYSPSGLAKYLARIREVIGEDKDTTDASGDDRTHPTFASRIVQINGLVKSNGIDANDLEINQARFSQATKNIK